MGKMRVPLIVDIIIIILVVASIAYIFYTNEPSVSYTFHPYVYQKEANGMWYTLNAKDPQGTQATPLVFARIDVRNNVGISTYFTITIKLTNATFPEDIYQNQRVDNTTLNCDYALSSHVATYNYIYFSIDNNTSGFAILTQFQSSQQLMHHTVNNWGGQTYFLYSVSANSTWVPAQIS
jgi:hypothetical protein